MCTGAGIASKQRDKRITGARSCMHACTLNTPAQGDMSQYYQPDSTSPNSSMEHGLVVELPDGKVRQRQHECACACVSQCVEQSEMMILVRMAATSF